MSWFLFYCRTTEIFVCCYVVVSFVPKVWKRIRAHAKENLKNLEKNNPKQICDTRTKLNKIEGKVTMIARQWEDNQVLSKQNVIDTNNPKVEIGSNSNNESKEDSNNQNRRKSSMLNNEWVERGIDIDDKENNKKSSNIQRRRSTVIEIAKKFERNESKSKIHMASKVHHIVENYFEGNKNTNDENTNQKQQKFNEDSDKSEDLVTEMAINKINNPKLDTFGQTTNHYEENEQEDKISYSSHENVLEQLDDVIKNENYFQEVNESSQDTHQIANGNDEDENIKESSSWSQIEKEDEANATTPTNETLSSSLPPTPPSSPSPTGVKLRKNHDRVQTVEDILKQQRFSRRLSAYSISEFLKDFPNEVEIDEIINNIEK